MPPGIQSTCAPGQFYNTAASGCRGCDTVCEPQYGGPDSRECLDRCPGYGLTTPTSTASPGHGSDVLPWIILAAACVTVAVVVASIICFKLWPKIKCCFRMSKICQPTMDKKRSMLVTEETGEGKDKLLVNTPSQVNGSGERV